jgi:hypothetical protein
MLEYQKSPNPGTASRVPTFLLLERNDKHLAGKARGRCGDGAISGTPA